MELKHEYVASLEHVYYGGVAELKDKRNKHHWQGIIIAIGTVATPDGEKLAVTVSSLAQNVNYPYGPAHWTVCNKTVETKTETFHISLAGTGPVEGYTRCHLLNPNEDVIIILHSKKDTNYVQSNPELTLASAA